MNFQIPWHPNEEFLAQAGHFLLGGWMVFFGFIIGHIYVCTGLVLAYMVIKEFTFDLWVEKNDIKTGFRDLAFLVGGVALAWCVLLLRGMKC